MADRVFPLSGDRGEELHKRGFTRSTTTIYSLPPAFDNNEERRRPCSRWSCCCCCYLCAAMAAFLVAAFVVGATLYLLLRPKAPTFSITRAHITQFALKAEQQRNGGASESSSLLHLQSDVNFTVVAENSNRKLGFHYEQVSFELVYGEQVIGRGALPAALYLGPRDRLQVELQVKESDTLLQERVGLSLRKALQKRPSSSDALWMQVGAIARLRIQLWSFRSRQVYVHIRCDVHMSRPFPHTDAHLLSKSCKLKSLTL